VALTSASFAENGPDTDILEVVMSVSLIDQNRQKATSISPSVVCIIWSILG